MWCGGAVRDAAAAALEALMQMEESLREERVMAAAMSENQIIVLFGFWKR